MFQMHIHSLFCLCFCYFWFFLLNMCWFAAFSEEINWLDIIMMSNDDVFFHFWSVDFLSFFVIVFLCSWTMETLSIMLCHCFLLSWYTWIVLNEAYHRFIALRIKLVLVTWFNSSKLWNSICFGLNYWILWNGVLHIISEIWKESNAIFQLNNKGLIVNHRPFSLDKILFTFFTIFAE